MPLSITTLNNEAAAAKTFVEIAKDKVSAEWLNTTDSNASMDSRLTVKQSLIGKNKAGNPIRRTLIQHRIIVGTSVAGVTEEVTCNLTITRPTISTSLTSVHIKDAVAFLRNLATGATVDAVGQGQV